MDAHTDFADAESPLLFFRPLRHPRLKEAAAALSDDRTGIAERTLLEFLAKHPENVDGLYLMAEAAARLGRWERRTVGRRRWSSRSRRPADGVGIR